MYVQHRVMRDPNAHATSYYRVLVSSPVQNFDFRLGVSVLVSVPAFPDSSC